ncbi:MAG: pantetheine-phosphate adenylyltransferase [Candidatus Levyibacteriota bacterium]
MNKKLKMIAIGGTFDYFHKGHEDFLKKAFLLSEKVLIGITSNNYVKSKKTSGIEEFEKRKKIVTCFLKEKNFLKRAKLIKINDAFGPTLKEKNIDALLISKTGLKVAEIINKKREEKKLRKLKIIINKMILAEDRGEISSRRIRNGEMNREGKLYVNKKWLKGKLLLPVKLRPELSRPFGRLLKDIEKFNYKFGFATVGDITTKKANINNTKPQIAIFDFLVRRKKTFENIKELGFKKNEKIVNVTNPSGHITADLFKKIISAFKKNEKTLILIKGEDDLAVLPLILSAPLGFSIYYGQPNEGIVEIFVNEETKEKAYLLASKFEFIS